MLPEVRVARIVEAIGRHRSGALSCVGAAAVLGMSARHFRRLRDRYEAEGAGGGPERPPARPGLGPAGAGGPDRVGAGAVPDALPGLHGQALPRAAGRRARVRPGRHVGEAGVAARAGSVKRARRSARRTAGGGQPLLRHPEGRREGRQGPADRGRAGAAATRHRAHPGGLARGARPHGERVSGTLQRRLPQELRPAGSATSEAANRFLAERFGASSPSATAASPWPRPSRAAPSCRSRAHRLRPSAPRPGAWSATTAACVTTESARGSRSSGTGITPSGRPSGCTRLRRPRPGRV